MCRKGDYSNSSVPREWRREELGFQLEKPWQLAFGGKTPYISGISWCNYERTAGRGRSPRGRPDAALSGDALQQPVPGEPGKLMTFLEYLVAEESKKNVSESDTQKD